jgi:class 3 adenylate cyclase
MELIEDLDPEEARRLVDPALKLMMDAVHRYEGYVAQSTGDGIFALLGASVAHEDHPQRALHAARRMQEDLKRYADKSRDQPIQRQHDSTVSAQPLGLRQDSVLPAHRVLF